MSTIFSRWISRVDRTATALCNFAIAAVILLATSAANAQTAIRLVQHASKNVREMNPL